MSDVNITINGRSYEISCDPGQEARIVDLAAYIDQRLMQISRSGAAYNDAHLLVLTTLVLADELFDARESGESVPVRAGKNTPQVKESASAASKEDEQAVAQLLDKLAKRIDGIAAKVQAA
jgi:cell division protein ZapA